MVSFLNSLPQNEVTNTSVSIANAFTHVKYIYAGCGKPHIFVRFIYPFTVAFTLRTL